jgi:hypothetical protein
MRTRFLSRWIRTGDVRLYITLLNNKITGKERASRTFVALGDRRGSELSDVSKNTTSDSY